MGSLKEKVAAEGLQRREDESNAQFRSRKQKVWLAARKKAYDDKLRQESSDRAIELKKERAAREAASKARGDKPASTLPAPTFAPKKKKKRKVKPLYSVNVNQAKQLEQADK